MNKLKHFFKNYTINESEKIKNREKEINNKIKLK